MAITYKLPSMQEAYAKLNTAQAAQWFTKEGYKAYTERKPGMGDKEWGKIIDLRMKLERLMNGGNV